MRVQVGRRDRALWQPGLASAMADGAGGDGRCAQQLEQCGSNQLSLELDILQLSQQWGAQRTIRNGDTPGKALRKGMGWEEAALSRAG